METIIQAVDYVVNSNMFWQSMGMTTSIAMFIGVFLYNGDIKDVSKAMLTILSYAFFVILTTVNRVFPYIGTGHFRAYAGVSTIAITTLFYILGLYFGVCLTKGIRKKKEI